MNMQMEEQGSVIILIFSIHPYEYGNITVPANYVGKVGNLYLVFTDLMKIIRKLEDRKLFYVCPNKTIVKIDKEGDLLFLGYEGAKIKKYTPKIKVNKEEIDSFITILKTRYIDLMGVV